ncbi:MAG: 4Fe-4S binding protein [Pelovirga sp.]
MRTSALFSQISVWRSLIQWGFFCWILYLGIRFGLFVRHFESAGATPFYSRPPGVEGFLPIGALVSLKHWLTTGVVDAIHPAALVLFVTFLTMSLLAKKSFCSWLCPVGTVSEGTWKLGRRLFGRNFRIWTWLDIPLRGLKYLLFFFFAKIILLDMPSQAIGAFIRTPYWAISDVKMLHFFTGMSLTALLVIAVLVVLSLFYKNFWCRYLCPYGALLGLLSMVSPMKIRRTATLCNGCQRCTRSCPADLPIHRKTSIHSPECIGCAGCVEQCPEKALAMSLPLLSQPLPRWVFPLLLVLIYSGGVTFGMVTGHWQTSLSYADYQMLIPLVPQIGH